MTSIKCPTSPKLQRWALFMSQFTYEIVYKNGRLHSNADGLSRMTYEPTGASTPTVTDELMEANFVNAVDLGMRESEFNSWLIQLSNENKASYRFGCELLHYTAAIDVDDEKLNMADLPRQLSGCCLVPTGCPVDETGSNEREAILSVTSEARRTAVSDVSWQPPALEAGRVLAEQITEQLTEQLLPFEKDIDFSAEALTPRVMRESYGRLEEAHQYSSKLINCELAAFQATELSVGDGRVPVESDAISSFSRQQNQSTVRRDPVRNDRSLDTFQQYPQSAEALRVK